MIRTRAASYGQRLRLWRTPSQPKPSKLIQIVTLVFVFFSLRQFHQRFEAIPVEQYAAALNDSSIEASRSKNSFSRILSSSGFESEEVRPAPIVGFTVTGGVGNQIYNMLEIIYLGRQVTLDLILPVVRPWRFMGRGQSGRREEIGSFLWDTEKLSEGIRGRTIYPYLPSQCRGKVDILYLFLRPHAKTPSRLIIPSEDQFAACLLSKGTPVDDDSSILSSGRHSCAHIFDQTKVVLRRQNLTMGGDQRFLKELRTLTALKTAPGKGISDPICAWISGHIYDRAGAAGDEFLYSHMHFLETIPSIAEKARNWPLDSMAVLHLRYDEKLCTEAELNRHKVCIRISKRPPKHSAVYWAPAKVLAESVVQLMQNWDTTSIYVASSPYAPTTIINELYEHLRERVKVENSAEEIFSNEDEINFLERELAIRAKVFIADFGSTWSGTVYYKRRTLNKVTHWSHMLLGKGSNLGYYSRSSFLSTPQ